MRNPNRYFEVQFTSSNFSVAELKAFAVDHEARLVNENPEGVFDDLVAATATAVDGISDGVGREKTAAAVQKARTAAKRHQLDKIRKTVSRKSGLVRSRFGASSPVYLEFFPRGLSQFHKAREAEVAGLLQRLVDAATAHLPELVPVFEELLDDWKAAKGEAARQRAAKGTSSLLRSQAFDILRRQLTKNLLTLSLHYLGQPEFARVYFNPSLLYNRRPAKSKEEELAEPILS